MRRVALPASVQINAGFIGSDTAEGTLSHYYIAYYGVDAGELSRGKVK